MPAPVAYVLDPKTFRDLSADLLDEAGQLKVPPASYFVDTTREERALFGARHAIYGLLTEELISWVKAFIGNRRAIEIGAGHGGLAAALNIHATDNRMQERPDIIQHYEMQGIKPIRYGKNVEELDAVEAVRRYQPDVVVASWVTHKYSEDRHEAGGNMYGVVEEDIVKRCRTYLFIGNTEVHKGKSIWSLPHVKLTPPWLYSRAMNGTPDIIALWGEIPPDLPPL
jgi:hypothetical protein